MGSTTTSARSMANGVTPLVDDLAEWEIEAWPAAFNTQSTDQRALYHQAAARARRPTHESSRCPPTSSST